MAPQEAILDVVGQFRQRREDVDRHGREGCSLRVSPVNRMRERSRVVVHQGLAGVAADFEAQGFLELHADGGRENLSLLGPVARRPNLSCQGAFRAPDLRRIIGDGRRRQFLLQPAAKLEITGNARVEVRHDLAPHLHREVRRRAPLVRPRCLRMAYGGEQARQHESQPRMPAVSKSGARQTAPF